MHPAGFSWQLAVILKEHPNILLLQHPWIPALPQGQLSCIPWHQCQVSLELSLERWQQEQVFRCSKDLDSASLLTETLDTSLPHQHVTEEQEAAPRPPRQRIKVQKLKDNFQSQK